MGKTGVIYMSVAFQLYDDWSKMSELRKKVNINLQINLYKAYGAFLCSFSCRFFTCLRYLPILLPIFARNMPMESYRHLDHAYFAHFEEYQKIKALEQKKRAFLHESLILHRYQHI